jgi:hypothetical protein
LVTPEKHLQKLLERIVVSIGFVDRKCKIMSEKLLSPN